MNTFAREQKDILVNRLREEPRRLIVVTGPRQTGKTTMVRQALDEFPGHMVLADETPDPMVVRRSVVPLGSEQTAGRPVSGKDTLTTRAGTTVRDGQWLVEEWQNARQQLGASDSGYVLAVDEVQKIPGWSEIVKGLWDADRLDDCPLHVVLLGSAPLLMQSGMNESLAGRFETIPLSHWSYPEMSALAGFDLDRYLYFGGYPGAADYIHDEERWQDYMFKSLIDPNIKRDILVLERVDKPALLQMLFELSAQYSGQIVSYTKLLGHLQDAGNTTTLARYLALLQNAGLVAGLQKYSGSVLRRRASSPKLLVLNTALMAVLSGYSFQEALADRTFRGRLVESAVGAHLLNTARPRTRLYYWREKNNEVDFVLQRGQQLVSIEVKSSVKQSTRRGFEAFHQRFNVETRTLTVFADQGIADANCIPLSGFLTIPADHWFKQ